MVYYKFTKKSINPTKLTFIRVYKSKLFKDKEIRIENYLTNNIFNYNILEDFYEFIY